MSRRKNNEHTVVCCNMCFTRRFFSLLVSVGISIVMLSLLSCGGPKGHPDEFIIKGKLKNSRGEKLMLRQLCLDSLNNIDSVNIDEEGSFTFRAAIQDPGFYLLGISKNNFVTLLLDKSEDVEFSGDALQLANDYTVKGSPGSQLLWELNRHTRKNYSISDSLFEVLTKSQSLPGFDSIKHLVDSSFNVVFEEQREYVRSFIKNNSSSLASLMALYQVFGQKKVISEKEDFPLYELLNNNLGGKYAKNDLVLELSQRVNTLKKEQSDRVQREARLDSGNVAPEIELKSLAGNEVRLSSLRGRTVLVHFWAGWSAQSQEAIPFYKYLNKTYGPKGFTLLGVSLDKDRQTWEDAVRQNKMSWAQVSDLMEWDSPLVKLYNVSSIPVAFLIDKEGRILCKRPDNETLTRFLGRIYRF